MEEVNRDKMPHLSQWEYTYEYHIDIQSLQLYFSHYGPISVHYAYLIVLGMGKKAVRESPSINNVKITYFGEKVMSIPCNFRRIFL